MRKHFITFLTLVAFTSLALAQSNDIMLIKDLKQHITTLASDSFQGRETGTNGEKLAYQYIVKEFQKAGLLPKGKEGFLQAFPFTRSIKAGPENKLSINSERFGVGQDFYPLPMSANKAIGGMLARVGYGIIAPELAYNDYNGRGDLNGRIFMMEYTAPDGGGPHSRYAAHDLRSRLDTAIARGAVGIIVVNSDTTAENPSKTSKNKITALTVPVIFCYGKTMGFLMEGEIWTIQMQAELIKEEATGHNILGYIDNKAKNTVVIGAHYDHLGFGDDESSLYRGEPAIHNGADDNASGVAALIELAKIIKESNDKSNNYLFIAFSGEEKGLLGSNYFMKNPTVPLSTINYMINMDMVGRLKTNEPVLIINGTGTSPAWKITMDYIKVDSLKTKTTESGVGPSDQTSFYLKNIPALHFFSGTHNDYHKPSDDESLINYAGETRIIDYIAQLVHRLNDKGKLEFTKTKDDTNESTPRFKVTLGVIPDYAYEGEGMRIDGVSDGKPASKAGLLAGDIVIKLGEVIVTDMTSYMKGLSMFNKGDSTTVKYKRGTEEITTEIIF